MTRSEFEILDTLEAMVRQHCCIERNEPILTNSGGLIHSELCYFYRVQEGWSSEFAQLLFDKPDQWSAILRANEDSLRKLKNLPQMPTKRLIESRPVTNDP